MKIKSIFVTAVLTMAFLCSAGFANAQATDNSALIAQLQAQIQSLMQQIQQLVAQQQGGQTWCHTFNNYLVAGSSNGDVSALQTALTKQGFDVSNDAQGTFGDDTASAVVQLQGKYSIKQTGTVGPLTRAKLNSFYGCNGQTPTPTPTPTPITPAQTTSILTPDQIKVISPLDTTISVGGKITITYVVGTNIVVASPAIIERSIINKSTNAMDSGYVPVSQSAGVYTFDWTPNGPGTYQAVLKISLNNTQYVANSGVITVTGTPISNSNLLTPVVSVNLSQSSVNAGQSVLLSWSSTNANRCVLSYGSTQENISVSGQKTVTPSQTTTYMVWCANDPGDSRDGPSSSKSATLSVMATQPSAVILTATQVTNPAPYIIGTASGVSQIGIVLQYASGDKAYGSGLVPVVNGNWSVTVSPALPLGQYTIYVYDANNNKLTSAPLAIIASIIPSATILTAAQVTNPTPYIIGTATGVSQISLSLAGQYGDLVYRSGLITVASDGSWSVTVSQALALGQYTIYIYDTNNNQLASKPFAIVAPATASATILTAIQVSNPSPYIIGTASGVSQISVSLAGQYGDLVYRSGLITVGADGNWSVTISPALPLGQYTIYIYDTNNNQLTSKPLTIVAP